MIQFGCDIAAGGGDKSVVYVREDNRSLEVVKWQHADTMVSAGKIIVLFRRYHPEKMVIDCDGIGLGVFDRLREQEFPVVSFKGMRKTERKDATGEYEFFNSRSYAWWHMRELLDPHGPHSISLIDDDDLKGDLCMPKYGINSSGKIVIESKPDIKKRLGRSPDTGDACVYAFCDLDSSHFEDGYTIYTGAEVSAFEKNPDEPERTEAQIFEENLWRGQAIPVDIFNMY
jgi:hypothetical protein